MGTVPYNRHYKLAEKVDIVGTVPRTVRKTARSGTACKGRYTDHDVDTEKRRARGPRPTASLLLYFAARSGTAPYNLIALPFSLFVNPAERLGTVPYSLVARLLCGALGDRALQPRRLSLKKWEANFFKGKSLYL